MRARSAGQWSAPAILLPLALLVAMRSPAHAGRVSVRRVEAIEGRETVVKIHLSAPLTARVRARLIPKGNGQPDRLAVDLPGADLNGKSSRAAEVGWGGVQRMRLGTPTAHSARLVIDLDRPLVFHVSNQGSTVQVTLQP